MRLYTKILLWLLALIITLTIAVYQRLTGPTHPVRNTEQIANYTVKYKLLRSSTAKEPFPVAIETNNPNLKGDIYYKRYKTDDPWAKIVMTRNGNNLLGSLPGQPIAGKIEYRIKISDNTIEQNLFQGQSIIARFKGKVPAFFLILHIITMFAGILFAIRTGIECLRKNGNYIWLVNTTFFLLVFGGLIMGPIVQKYAFGDLWTGFPFGTDLTDNKVLLLVLIWIVALIFKRKNRWIVFSAVIIMILIYIIPHSLYGSELDYDTGKMKNKYSYYFLQEKSIKQTYCLT